MALTDLVDDERFFPMLQELQSCLCAELAKANGPALCYCGLMVGDIVPLGLMDCSSAGCGVAWVRPMQTYPSLQFPNPSDYTPCNAPLVMQIEMGVGRCYPRAEGRAARPSEQQMFDAARIYLSDMQAMKRAIVCCFGKRTDGIRGMLGAWTPIPAGAGSSGGTWTIFAG